MKSDNQKQEGYVMLPYTIVTVKTTVNGETVWYKNKFKNFLLRVKNFFHKSKNLKNHERYSKIKVDPKMYGVIKNNIINE